MTLSTTRIQELKTSLVKQLTNNGFKLDINGEIISDDLKHPFFINVVNSTTVLCQFRYALFPYENIIVSKRDAIKTAKDICEFYHELKLDGNEHIPKLRLIYKNSTTGRWVAVTHHVLLDYNDLYFNGGETIQDEVNKMNLFSQAIEKDVQDNPDSRWTKETLVPKKWWTH